MATVYLSWERNGTDNDSSGVERRSFGTTTWVNVSGLLPAAQVTYQDTSVADDTWEYRAVKTNTQGSSYSDLDTVIVATGSVAPTVDAGVSLSGDEGTPIQLAATITNGTDTSPTILWSVQSGGTGTFSNTAIEDPTFTPDAPGSFVLQLSVDPDDGAAVVDSVVLTSVSTYTAPIVEAGTAKSGDVSTAIAMAATVTNGTDASPTLLWTIVSGGAGTFSNSAIEDPTFTPSAVGAYVLQLSADPSDGSAVTDTVSVTSNAVAPTVEAGTATSGEVSTAIQLAATVTNGSDSSPTLLWTIVSGGTGTFSNAAIEDPTFTPDSEGAYTLQLSADPSDGAAVTDTVGVTSNSPGVTAPVVDAGSAVSGDVSTAISLNATITNGTDTSPAILWTIVSGGTGTFSNAAIEDPTFTPDSAGAYVLQLSVDPDDGAAVTDTVSLTSNAIVTAPTVDAGSAVSGDVSTAIALNATITNGSDTSPTILWTIVSGGSGAFSSTSVEDPTFTPSETGSYVLQLSVDPDDGAAVTDTVTLTSNAVVTAPTVDAGVALSGTVSTAIQLAATITNGSDTSPVIAWTIVSGGTGTFSSTTIEDPTFTPDATGAYTLQLSVDPDDGSAVVDTVVLTSNAAAGLTLVVEDGFSGTNGDDMDGRTPDTTNTPGNNWAEHVDGGDHVIDTNAAKATTASEGTGPIIDLGNANVELQMDIKSLSVYSNMALFLRSPSTDAFGKWSVAFNGNNLLSILEGGVSKQSATVSGTAVGSTLRAWIDSDDIIHAEIFGTEITHDTAGVNSTVTEHGFSAGTGAVGNKIEAFRAYTL